MRLILDLNRPYPFELTWYNDLATDTSACYIATPDGQMLLLENVMNSGWQVKRSSISEPDFQQAILEQAATLFKLTRSAMPVYPLNVLYNS